MATDPNDIRLDDQLRRQLAQIADESGRIWRDIIQDALAQYVATKRAQVDQRESLLERATKAGFVAVIDGPPDLSTNRRYMDGFGGE